MLLKGAISSNNNPQGHDDGGHPDYEDSKRIKCCKIKAFRVFTRMISLVLSQI